MEESISILDKATSDLTVRDALKINGVIVAVMVAVPLVIGLGGAAYNKVSDWKLRRKNETPTPEVESATA